MGFAFAGWTGLLLSRSRQPTSLEIDEPQIVVRQGDRVRSDLYLGDVDWAQVVPMRQGGRLQVKRRSRTPRLEIVPLGRIPAAQVEAALRAAGWPSKR